MILGEHEKLIGKTPDAAKTEYLNTVKNCEYYGTTFYPPCKMIGCRGKVVIGIYNEGIRLFKYKSKVSLFPFFVLFPFHLSLPPNYQPEWFHTFLLPTL